MHKIIHLPHSLSIKTSRQADADKRKGVLRRKLILKNITYHFIQEYSDCYH